MAKLFERIVEGGVEFHMDLSSIKVGKANRVLEPRAKSIKLLYMFALGFRAS